MKNDDVYFVKIFQNPCLEKDIGEKGDSQSQNREKIQGETDYLVDPFNKQVLSVSSIVNYLIIPLSKHVQLIILHYRNYLNNSSTKK